VVSLYTNVPVLKAIEVCSNLLYSGNYKKPPVDKKTFKELLTICSYNVIMLTHDGLYRQIDGLAMSSPPAPMLANSWMSTFDSVIKDDAVLYSRYMDDILRSIGRDFIAINCLHPSPKFTVEKETNNLTLIIALLDMEIHHQNNKLASTWHTKSTDTGLIMNYHALYKKSVVSGMIHRIFRACSSYQTFHESLEKAKVILENNQYLKSFIDPIIQNTLIKLFPAETETEDQEKKQKRK